jgi:hypothetical protein
MSKTENFRRQHTEIRQVVREMSAFLDSPQLVAQADQVRLLLSELAARYVAEMGGIKKTFMDYAHKWRASKAIEAAPQEFIGETRGIVAALTERMRKEDAELYTRIDKQS